ncbi:MAG: hypothetical protein Q4C49_05310 [Bacillota bacterium]|nr:hypothetical protein [Bacillota bacterium]
MIEVIVKNDHKTIDIDIQGHANFGFNEGRFSVPYQPIACFYVLVFKVSTSGGVFVHQKNFESGL